MSITNRDSPDKRVAAAAAAKDNSTVYDVEHLATFSTTARDNKTDPLPIASVAEGPLSAIDNTLLHGEARVGLVGKVDQINGASADSTKAATTTPRSALQRLFELEKQSGIWTQHMQIRLKDEFMLIADCESNAIVERFHRDCVTKPEAFSQHNDIYNNIVVFILDQSKQVSSKTKSNALRHKRKEEPSKKAEVKDSEISDLGNHDDDKPDSGDASSAEVRELASEIHIFQCVSHEAQQIVSDILAWKSRPPPKLQSLVQEQIMNKGRDDRSVDGDETRPPATGSENLSGQSTKQSSISPSSPEKPIVKVASSTNENVPIVNVNVKETVQVFNQIAALRERGMPTSPTSHASGRHVSDASTASLLSSPNKADSSSADQSNGANSLSTGADDLGGVQLYKQRSMRATLAPKISSSAGQTSETATGKPSSASAGSSSSVTTSSSGSSGVVYGAKMNGHPLDPERDPVTQQQAASSATKSASRPQNGSTPKHVNNQPNSSKQQSRHQQARSKSDYPRSQAGMAQNQNDQVSSNESYVSVLNHCFDDIEKFIIRLQQSIAASRELFAAKRKASSRSSYQTRLTDLGVHATKGPQGLLTSSSPITASEMALLGARARGPSEEDYFEILSKFKLAFNLLAKLKGCIHEPNAPELVHFLFTPLAIIIESARNALPQIDPTVVGIPYLNQDALDLLSNCCTSKESDLWMSLGPNWTQTIDVDLLKASRLPSSFQPIFSDGWAPVIGELELIGLVGSSSLASIVASTATMDSHDGRSSGSSGTGAGASAEASLPSDVRQYYHSSAQSHDIIAGRKTSHLPATTLSDEPPAGSSRYSNATSNYPPGTRQSRSNGIKQSSNHHHQQTSRGGGITSGLDHRRRIANAAATTDRRLSPDPSFYQPDHINARHLIDPYHNKLNPVPYGYLHQDANIELEQEQELRNYYRGSASELHYKRGIHPTDALASANQALGYSSRNHHQHRLESAQPNPYDPVLDYPLVEDGSNLDVDSYRHGSRAHNGPTYSRDLDDHIEPRQYNGRVKSYPASSKHQHREPRARGSQSKTKDELDFYSRHPALQNEADYMSENDHEAMLLDLGPAQTEWFYELQSRGALIVRVLFTRDANNDKELSVRRGEILEVLDDTRKWWRARNINLLVAHVPHTIVAVMNGYLTLDELLANNPPEIPNGDPNNMVMPRTNQGDLISAYNQRHWHRRDDAHNSKTSGAFRYF